MSFNAIVLKRVVEKEKSHDIIYGFAPTTFGDVFIAFISDKSNEICHLHFLNIAPKTCIQQLQKRWPHSRLSENNNLVQLKVKHLFDAPASISEILVVNGTAFQLDVWNALLTIPVGELRTYSDIAELLKKPKAVRAVANAVASNEIAFLIPCHRVVSKGGNLLKYRWGGQLKKQLMEFEQNLNKAI